MHQIMVTEMAKRDGVSSKRIRKVKVNVATSRWTLAGVNIETREAVARAAKKDGVPIGTWVDQILRETAEMRLKVGGPRALALPPGLLDILTDLSQRVRELSERGPIGNKALQRVHVTASELGDQISSTYDAVVKRADSAIAEVRSWTDGRFDDAVKWGTGVIEQLKSAANGIERLQTFVTRQDKAEENGRAPPPAMKKGPASNGKPATTRRATSKARHRK